MEPSDPRHARRYRSHSAGESAPAAEHARAQTALPPSGAGPAEASHSRQECAHCTDKQEALNAPLAWTADAAGHLTAGVESWCAFTGQSSEDAAGAGWLAVVHPAERAQAAQDWAQAVAAGTAYTREHRVRCAQGGYHLMRVWATPLRAAGGDISAWVGVCTDLTERRDSERALADALAREQAALARAARATARLRASRREAATAARELRELQALTDTALTHLSLDDLLRELLSRLQIIMRVDNVAILLLDERARMLTVHAARGPEEVVVDKVHVPLGQGFAGRIAASRAPLIVNDLSRMDVVNPLLREALRSVIGVPLLMDARVLGVVHAGTARRRHFTAHDVELLRWAADRIALGIERARLFEATQQARAQTADQAQELEELLEAMPDAVMVFDRHGGVRRMNSAACELLGLNLDSEYYARPLADRGYRATISDENNEPLPQDQWPFVRILRGEVLMGSEAVDIHYRLPGRVDVRVSVIGAPLRNAQGHITGAVCALRDVTERRQMEQRTREALAAMLAMAEALVAPVGDVLPAEPFSLAPSHQEPNGAPSVAQRLVELAREVLGCARVAILAIDQETEAVQPLAVTGLTPERERIWREQWTTPRPLSAVPLLASAAHLESGDVLVLDLTRPPYDALPNPYGIRQLLLAPMHVGGQLVGLLALDHGESGHEYLGHEKTLADGVARLAALVVERERLLREHEAAQAQALALEAANRQMNEFLSVASHELKTPVTIIKANLQMLEREHRRQQPREQAAAKQPADASRSQELAERARRGMDRLAHLVDDLLDISRVQAGHLELRRVPCDVREVVREVVTEAREAYPQRTIHLRETDAKLDVSADPDRLRQVVVNYLTNALKYSPEDRPVTVRVWAEERTAHVAVDDEGPGIPPHEQDRLWEIYHRVPGIEVQSGSGVGLGLGLHICKTIIERHGGQVGVQSTVGQGSSFWFTLPLGAAPDASTADDNA